MRKINQSILVIDSSYSHEEVKRRGIEHTILARSLEGYFSDTYNFYPYGSSNKFSFSELQTNIDLSCILISGIIPLTLRSISGGFLFFKNVFKTILFLKRFISSKQIKIIRVGDPLFLGILGYILSILTNAKFVIRVSGNNQRIRLNTGLPMYPRLFVFRKIEELIEKFIFTRAHGVMAPNFENMNYALIMGAAKNTTHVIRYGNLIDPIYFQSDYNQKKRAINSDNNYILLVSRLEKLKYPEDAIFAYIECQRFDNNLKLKVAGTGENKDQLIKILSDHGLESKVNFLGNISQTDLYHLYKDARLFLSPLCGRALSEAALVGTPTVAYDLDWQNEIIIHGKTGLIVPFRDKRGFSLAARKLIMDENLATKLGNNLASKAEELLNPEMIISKEKDFYNQILKCVE